MWLHRAGIAVVAASCASVLLTTACGSSSRADPPGASGASGGGGPSLGGLAGTSTSGGVSNPGDQCAGDLLEAKNLPLDMYVMLDVSGSMLEQAGSDATTSKWQAVSDALLDFVNDPASAGIGMGLQVFPINDPAAPDSCTTDEQCGTHGPCANRGCWPLIDGEVVSCLTSDTCRLSQECVVIGECAGDRNYVCNHETTTMCDQGRGACVVPASQCLLTADCRPETYASPAAEIAELPGAAAAISAVIKASTPDPGALTPTGPALSGALRQAATWATAHTNHQVVAVLATDGLPTLQEGKGVCSAITRQTEINAVPAMARTALNGTPPISTFVIGVVGADDVGATDTLGNIARLGGTQQAFLVDPGGNVAAQFREALDAIRATRLSCELEVPSSDNGKAVDYQQVNVELKDGSGAANLVYVGTAAGCETAQMGWYYDVPDATAEVPKRIITCPDTCARFGTVETGSVQIKLGCATRTPVK